MATKTETARTVAGLLEAAPRVAELLEREGTHYLGACIVQAPGAWSRVGPTWIVPSIGWITIGPGLWRWGTSEGLAELATSCKPNPNWHAVGLTIVPAPNIAFAICADVLKEAPHMGDVRGLADEVAGWARCA